MSSRVTLAAIDRRICQHTKTRQHGCAQFVHWSKEECALTVNSSTLGLICACLMQPHHLITHAWLPQGRVWKEDWFQGGKIKKRTILILLLITKSDSTTVVVVVVVVITYKEPIEFCLKIKDFKHIFQEWQEFTKWKINAKVFLIIDWTNLHKSLKSIFLLLLT